jgi:hypothetical protein
MLKTLFTLLLATNLVSCTPYAYYNDGNQSYEHEINGSQPIYSVNDKGKVIRERRMEHVRSRGCEDYSTDCMRPVGW